MASLSIQRVDEQLAALLKQRAAAARKSVSQFVVDTRGSISVLRMRLPQNNG